MKKAHRSVDVRAAARARPRLVTIVTLLSAAAIVVGCTTTSGGDRTAEVTAQPQPDRRPVRTIDEDLAVRTFEEAWRIIRDTHFDPQLGGVDWEGVRERLLPVAAAALTDDELRMVLNEMLMELGLSHFAIIPRDIAAGGVAPGSETQTGPSSSRPTDPRSDDGATTTSRESGAEYDDARVDRERTLGLDVRILDGLPVVTAVAPDGPAATTGVRPGWIVDEVDGRSIAPLLRSLRSSEPDGRSAEWNEYVAHAVLMELLQPRLGRPLHIAFLDDGDRRIETELVGAPLAGEVVEIGALRLSSTFSARRVDASEISFPPAEDAGGSVPHIAVIAFSTWIVQIAEPFHRAIDEHRRADGIIIDLRGNPGGLGGLVMGIGGHFVTEPKSLGSFRSRDGTLHFRTNPRRVSADGELVAPYEGPVAILLDGMSASTTEIFAGGLQSIGRARVFGSTSAGAALPAAMSRLPNGDTLLHAIADFILPDGRRIEGEGVVPDEVVVPTRADLLAGRDPTLLAAIRWICHGTEAQTSVPLMLPTHARIDRP